MVSSINAKRLYKLQGKFVNGCVNNGLHRWIRNIGSDKICPCFQQGHIQRLQSFSFHGGHG